MRFPGIIHNYNSNRVGKFIRDRITDMVIKLNMDYKNIVDDDKQQEILKIIKGLNINRILWSKNKNLRELRDQIVGNQGEDLLFEKQLNSKRYLLSVKNGVIDLRTGKVRNRTREDMLDYE